MATLNQPRFTSEVGFDSSEVEELAEALFRGWRTRDQAEGFECLRVAPDFLFKSYLRSLLNSSGLISAFLIILESVPLGIGRGWRGITTILPSGCFKTTWLLLLFLGKKSFFRKARSKSFGRTTLLLRLRYKE